MKMLTVMSLNCNCLSDKHGPWEKRAILMADLIARIRPDIILFQAAALHPVRTNGIDQGSEIARMADYPYAVFEQSDCMPDRLVLGQTIISKYPVTGVETLQLSPAPGIADRTKRLVMKGEVLLNEGILYLYNAYFSWIAEQTRQNLEESLPFINKCDGMALLMGDLNTPEMQVFEPLRKAGWKDVWILLKKETAGATFESHKPEIRIDYAWANEYLEKYVDTVETFNHQSEDGLIRMSDHLALMVTLTLNPS
ncbi:MAG: endonuclease/exonuclease/phosphatase family protein [Candidatus Omnitrophota bacterium]